MKVDLKDRIAIVTGAAGAIGHSTALALAENGAIIALADLTFPEHTCNEINERGGKAHAYQIDISDPTAVDAMMAKIEAEVGPVAILANGAGISPVEDRFPVHQFPDSEWHRILRTNLDGVFYCSRAASAQMVLRCKGAIINIASVFGVVPARMQCAHAAAQSGIMNFTRAHALEVGQYGIRVNGVAPGLILTEDAKTAFYSPPNKQSADSWLSHIPLGAPGKPEDIAAAVLYLASDAAKNVTGQTIAIDGGWTTGFSRDW